MNSENQLKWIDSGGGPLILLEESLLCFWGGFEPQRIKEDKNYSDDYDRACDVEDYVGIIPVGSGYGLVLGQGPFHTGWRPFSETEDGFLVCWVYAENKVDATNSLVILPTSGWEKTKVKFQSAGGKLVLFDSAFDGEHFPEKLDVELAKGFYNIETLHYKPNESMYLIIHRFRLSD